jgi:primosomal protein N' (replication factor Y)
MASVTPLSASIDSVTSYCRVALDVPLAGPFDYRSPERVTPGDRVIVPFGRRRLIGVVIQSDVQPSLAPEQIKPIERVLRDLEPLPARWLELATFAASYYQRPVGEVLIPALPVPLRRVASYEGKRAGQAGPVVRLKKRLAKSAAQAAPHQRVDPIALNDEQAQAVAHITANEGFRSYLLHGITGSGKTQVYLAAAQTMLARGARVLFLVPEINLTPQFAQALLARLGGVVSLPEVAVLHSRLADGERLDAWVRTLQGQARIVLGTRLAIFAPMPDIDLIVVDEEHDPSYKQQEGLRYSARDLAVWRARQEQAVVVLGSATPSLETWHRSERGDYQRLVLTKRATAAALPSVKLIDTRRLPMDNGLSPQLLEAITTTLAQDRQVLVYLNRRGYAPVLHCGSCGWVSQCDHCTAFSVVHRNTGHRMRLHCHHCGAQRAAPSACPVCGDPDLQPMGRGTQRLEEHLAGYFPNARISRIDADSTRRKGSAEGLFEQVHAGEVDILGGTQMVSKGHDFANLGLVGVINADAMLFSQDFRAPERLFAQLMQVAGRAGRDGRAGTVMVQTGYPEQPLYQALQRHDFEGFASSLISEREMAQLPPFSFQALLTAEATELPDALGFLAAARATALAWLQAHQLHEVVTLYDAVPLRVVRVAKVCRAQLLIEATSRSALHRLLRGWLPGLGARHASGGLRWQLEVDPLEI